MSLATALDSLRQRTGLQDLTTRTGLSQFQSAARADFGNIVSQWNTVLKPLLESIAEPPGVDALIKGLSANTLWSDVDASSGSSSVFWDAANSRRKTIKESFDWLAVELASVRAAGAALAASVLYTPEDSLIFQDTITNLQEILTILSYGSGAFSLSTYPDLTGVLWNNAGTWEKAQADDALGGAGGFKAIQLSTSLGTKYMLSQGKAYLPAALLDNVPTAGDVLYLSEAVAGNLTTVAPSSSGETVQVIGYVIAVDGSGAECYIDIQHSYDLIP